MKKLFICGLAVILLAGCGKKQSATEADLSVNSESTNTEFTTIKEAVTKSIAIECDYADPEDGEQTKVYFKGPLVGIRPGANSKNPDMAGLLKDNKIYLWSPAKSEGFTIDLTQVETNSTISVAGKQVKSGEDVINALEPHRQNCKPTNNTSVFELPQNITFKAD